MRFLYALLCSWLIVAGLVDAAPCIYKGPPQCTKEAGTSPTHFGRCDEHKAICNPLHDEYKVPCAAARACDKADKIKEIQFQKSRGKVACEDEMKKLQAQINGYQININNFDACAAGRTAFSARCGDSTTSGQGILQSASNAEAGKAGCQASIAKIRDVVLPKLKAQCDKISLLEMSSQINNEMIGEEEHAQSMYKTSRNKLHRMQDANKQRQQQQQQTLQP